MTWTWMAAAKQFVHKEPHPPLVLRCQTLCCLHAFCRNRPHPIPNLAHSDILTSPCTPAPLLPRPMSRHKFHEALSPPSLPERVADGVFLAGSAADITHRGRVRTSKSKQDDGCRRNADERQPLNNTELKQETKDSDEAKHTTSQQGEEEES